MSWRRLDQRVVEGAGEEREEDREQDDQQQREQARRRQQPAEPPVASLDRSGVASAALIPFPTN